MHINVVFLGVFIQIELFSSCPSYLLQYHFLVSYYYFKFRNYLTPITHLIFFYLFFKAKHSYCHFRLEILFIVDTILSNIFSCRRLWFVLIIYTKRNWISIDHNMITLLDVTDSPLYRIEIMSKSHLRMSFLIKTSSLWFLFPSSI